MSDTEQMKPPEHLQRRLKSVLSNYRDKTEREVGEHYYRLGLEAAALKAERYANERCRSGDGYRDLAGKIRRIDPKKGF